MKRIWKTKDGKKLRIKDMSIEHIQNCIKLLNRYHAHQLCNDYSFLDALQGELAIDTMENNIANLEENGWEDEAEEYIESFENELLRRK